MSDDAKSKTVRIWTATAAKVEHLSGLDERSFQQELDWLVNEQLRARGIDPESVVQANGKCFCQMQSTPPT